MASIIDTLITDRTQADVERARYLNTLWDARAGRWRGTPEEWAEWMAGPRGAYGFADMNRVTQAAAYLIGQLEAMGYSVDTGNVTPAYNIRVSAYPAGGGIASGTGVFFEGDTATVAAQAGEKYDFVGWMEAGETVSTDLVYTFTVEHSRNLTAKFALKKFQVVVSVDPSGAGEATGAGTYDIDTEVTVAVTAGDGYVFTRWTENGDTVAEGAEYTFVLTQDRNLSAVMTKTYVITVSADNDDGGTVSGGGTYLAGQTVTVAAVSGDGYEFTGWQENGNTVSEDTVYSFPAGADRDLVAVFVKTYVVTLLVDPAGSGTATGGGTFREGQQITVTAAPGGDYRFVAWKVDGEQVSANAAYTFTVSGNSTLTAVFEEIPVYTITVTIDPAGSGTVIGAGQHQEGQTVTITATPADGYKFSGWQEGGQTVSAEKEYTFTVTADRALTAAFEEKVSRLPAGYTEIEYIESVKGGYYSIKTPIGNKKSLGYLKIALDIMGTDASFTGSRSIAISKNTNSSTAYSGFEIDSAQLNSIGVSVYRGTNLYGGKSVSGSFLNKRVLIEADFLNKTFSVDGISASFYSPSGTLTSNVYLYSNTTSTSPVPFRLYSAKLISGAGLSSENQYDFVPCKNPSGIVGLYELVEGVFYKNEASGTFTAGPAV